MQPHLCKRAGIELELARDFQSDIVTCFRVPRGLGTSFYIAVDFVVIACGEDAQVVGGMDCGRILCQAISDSGRVFRHRGLLNIVACLSSDEESFMSEHSIEIRGRTFEKIEEGAEVEVWLLVVEVQFTTVRLLGGEVVGEHFGFEASGELVFKFDLGIQRI